MSLFISVLASLAAFIGGIITLKFKDKLHIFIGLSAGAVIGATLFDLIPEAIELGAAVFHPEELTALTGVGFLLYLVLDRIFSFHAHGAEHENLSEISGESKSEDVKVGNTRRGSLGAASFCLHSLIDGIAIGLAFQVSTAVGAVVAIAVIAHRFSDGINTVGVILKHYGNDRSAFMWLIAVAVAPIIGTLLASRISVPDHVLAIVLAVFAGFFLYIGASDLIPEGQHSHSKALTTIMTVAGAGILYIIVQLAHA